MCGICGFNWEDRNLANRMSRVISHRGPNDHGHYTDRHISLGHRRLSIIDLSEKGKQPMHNEDSSIWLVYNGEIYNHKQLREELEKKEHKFHSNTDTETIIHAYEEYGEDCVKYFNGMFAFAIWDSNKKKLFLARDRIGIKPLYYYFKDNKLIFASEIKAILEHDIKREVNLNALHNYFAFLYVPSPDTLLNGVKKLAPGTFLTYDGNELIIKKYWNLEFHPKEGSTSYYTKTLYEEFKKSVERRLMSDVPLGAYLSGGMDSSSIVAMMSLMKEKVTTFSVGFDSDEVINELYYAKKVADKLNTEHNEIIVTVDDAIKILPKITWHLDEPIVNPASVPLYFMSNAAKKKMTVVLTGNGGDEIFAGYRQHKIISISNFYYNKMPLLFNSRITQGVINLLNKKISEKSRYKKYVDFASKFIKTLKDPSLSYKALMGGVFTDEEKEDLLVERAGGSDEQIVSHFFNNSYHILNQLTLTDIKLLLPENYLMVDDKINMANSVESRVPFLDHTLVEFAATIPPKLKLKGLTGKYILKKTMKDLLPKEVIARKKYGFTPPVTAWIDKHFKSEAISLLLESDFSKRKYFDKSYLQKILNDNTKKHYNKIFPLVMFAYWHKYFIEGEKV